MAKGKYQEWLEPDGLTRLRAYARDGLTDEDIAGRMNISPSTFYEWKKKYPEISEALKRGKEVVDVEVENALLKRALGYTIKVAKNFKLKKVTYDPITCKKIREEEELVIGYDEVHIPAEVAAQGIWLFNRKPEAWRRNPGGSAFNPDDENGVGIAEMPRVDFLEEDANDTAEKHSQATAIQT